MAKRNLYFFSLGTFWPLIALMNERKKLWVSGNVLLDVAIHGSLEIRFIVKNFCKMFNHSICKFILWRLVAVIKVFFQRELGRKIEFLFYYIHCKNMAPNSNFRSNYLRKIPVSFGIYSDLNVFMGRFLCATVKSLAGFFHKNNKTAL